MCLIFVAIDSHPDFPIIIAANRDEFYQRPTAAAQYWSSNPEILAGKDLQAGGTWLGVNRNADFAAITNFREVENVNYSSSRGELTTHFLQHQELAEFSAYLSEHGQEFSGFNCIFGKLGLNSKLHYYSNRQNTLIPLTSGIYGLSNALLDENWFKVEAGKAQIETLFDKPFCHEQWFAFLRDETQAQNQQLPNTGIPIATEQLLSSRFIHSQDYGTRCSTLITVDQQGQLQFCERSYDDKACASATNLFQFPLNSPH